MKVIFRPQFWRDLEEGVAYLAVKASPNIAQRWHAEVMETAARVKGQPGVGRVCHDLTPPGIRSLILHRFPRYLLFYRWDADAVEILRVKHGRMYLPALFDPSKKPPPG